jgi:hypothetical protein
MPPRRISAMCFPHSLLPTVEDLFGASIFFQLCVSVMVFCTTGVILLVTQEFDNFFKAFSNTIYFCLILFKILMYCHVGNDLIYAVIDQIAGKSSKTFQ